MYSEPRASPGAFWRKDREQLEVFELLTGVNPYLENQTELNAVLVAHATESPPWERLPQIPQRAALVDLLRDASRLDPRQRITMKQFIARWSALMRA